MASVGRIFSRRTLNEEVAEVLAQQRGEHRQLLAREGARVARHPHERHRRVGLAHDLQTLDLLAREPDDGMNVVEDRLAHGALRLVVESARQREGQSQRAIRGVRDDGRDFRKAHQERNDQADGVGRFAREAPGRGSHRWVGFLNHGASGGRRFSWILPGGGTGPEAGRGSFEASRRSPWR